MITEEEAKWGRKEKRQEEIKVFIERGKQCQLWGFEARHMDRDELLATIGFFEAWIERIKAVVM